MRRSSRSTLVPYTTLFRSVRVAIQGIATSFHEVAAMTYFNEPIETIECLSFHQLFESVNNNNADYAVMAIENSIAGSILPNYFLDRKSTRLNSSHVKISYA